MSLPTLPTSQGDIVIPLPGQTTIDSRTKQLQEKANTRTPSGLVVDPVQLLQCVSGSDSAYNYNTVTSYSHTGHHAHTSSTSSSHKPIFSYPKPEAGHSQTDGSSQPTLPSPTDEAKEVEHFEVDPHARGVLTFRRNSMRQFSSIIEENENKEKSSYPPPTGNFNLTHTRVSDKEQDKSDPFYSNGFSNGFSNIHVGIKHAFLSINICWTPTEFSETPNQAYFYANFWFCTHTFPAGDSNLRQFFFW